MGQRTRQPKDRAFRRLEERERTTAPIPVAAVSGALLGAVGALAFTSVDLAITAAAGLALAPMSMLGLLAAAVASVGALLGGLTGLTGLWGARWASAMAVVGTGWLLAGRLAVVPDSALGATVAFGLTTIAALGLGQVAGRVPGPAWAHMGGAALLFVFFAVAAPLHLHVVTATASIPGLVVSGAAFLLALPAAVLVSLMTGDGRPPVVPLVLVGAIGGVGTYLLAPRAADTTWAGGEAAGPAVVVIDVSGLRPDRTGPGGYARDVTPQLDRFAAGAVRFEGAHATSNWTVPSLGSVLTGRLPYAHGAGLHDGARQRRAPLRPEVQTLGLVLQRQGWATAAVVGDTSLRRYWLDAGFDVWWDGAAWGPVPAVLAPVVAAGLDVVPWPSHTPAEEVTDRALSLLAQQQDRGWMMLVQYADAGGPFHARDEDQQAVGFTTRAHPHDVYDAALHGVDAAVGRLLDEVPDDAWVVVLADRGLHLTEERTAASQGRPGARWGHTMYEELLSVPLWIRAPGREPRAVPEVVSLVDVTPTLLAALGLDALHTTDGQPLEAVLGGAQTAHAAVAQSSYWGVERQAVVLGRYKVVDVADGKTPMFDLESDPEETAPLRTTPENDKLERQLLAVLPPAGAGVDLQEPPTVTMLVGRLLTRFVE